MQRAHITFSQSWEEKKQELLKKVVLAPWSLQSELCWAQTTNWVCLKEFNRHVPETSPHPKEKPELSDAIIVVGMPVQLQ